jgi:hypothetical protein
MTEMPGPDRWVCVISVADTISAAAMVSRLEGEGVPARIEKGTQILGEGQLCAIVVPARFERQAISTLADGQFTDDELAFLATGQMSCDDAKE